MSLIHEALKRVQTNKTPVDIPGPVEMSTSDAPAPAASRNGSVSPYAPQGSAGSSPGGRPGPVPPPWLTAGGPAMPPLVPPPPPSGPSRILFSKSPIILALGLAIAIGSTLMMMSVVQREMGLPSVAPAGTPARPATPPPKASPAKATPRPSAQAAPAAPVVMQITESPAPAPAPAAASLLPLAETTPPPQEKAAPARSNNPPAAAARFRVSGIMSGPTGGAALINGRMIYVGQEIDGARLVRTTANTVVMETEGVRFTLGISQ